MQKKWKTIAQYKTAPRDKQGGCVDIVVYTIDEWDSFVNLGSSFSRVVIEKASAIA
jgi:hypothetical protein